MNQLPLLRERLIGCPLLVSAEKANTILAVIGADRLDLTTLQPAPEANRLYGRPDERLGGAVRRHSDGTALVPLVGSFVNRGAYVGASSGLISYEGTSALLDTLDQDSTVDAIILDMDSGGGEAAGALELADQVRDIASRKPVVAFVNSMAASAAYAIASSASHIVTLPSGVVGSIGVVLVHEDRSEQAKANGVARTLIFAGDRKVDGNPFEPLSEAAAASLKGMVDSIYDRFTATVGKGRGSKLTADAARATQAGIYSGADAVAAGLADEVGTLATAFQHIASLRGGGQRMRTSTMENDNPAADTAAIDDARRAGATAERERLTTALSAEGVAGHASRMSAVVSLAALSPDADADALVAHAVAHASPAKPSASLDDREAEQTPLATPAADPGTNSRLEVPDAAAIYADRKAGNSK